MPATIHWKPITKGGVIEGGNSGVVDMLMHEFGADFARQPLILTDEHMGRLMEIAEEYPGQPNPYQHLITLIMNYGEVKITTSH